VLTCGQRSLRLAPPLIVNAAQANTALAILADACEAVAAGLR
jgi:4-aminobutyrate aminotransferase-like enzyme